MNAEHITEAIKILEALSDGRVVEWRWRDKPGGAWWPMSVLMIDLDVYEYRKKPLISIWPLNHLDWCGSAVIWLKYPQCDTQVMVTEIIDEGVFAGTSKGLLKWQYLFDAKYKWSTDRQTWHLCQKEST